MRGVRAGLGLLVLAGCPVDVATTEVASTTGGSGGRGTDSMGTSGAPVTGGGDETGPTSGGEPATTGAPGDTDTAGTSGSTGGGSSSTGEAERSSSSGEAGAGSSGSSGGDVAPFCGDGQVDPGEGCDDGNGFADDGCSPACEVGPGAEVVLEVPLLGEFEEQMRCLAIVDKQHVDGVSHAVVLGGRFLTPTELKAHVWRMPLGGGAPHWSYAESAGIYGRLALEAATAANGDVVVVGQIYTEAKQADSGGYLWMARFSPAGALVWSVETEDVTTMPVDLALTSDGDIVFAGHTAGYSTGVYAHRFRGSDGSLVWSHDEVPDNVLGRNFTSLAIDEDDNVYLGGYRYKFTDDPDEPSWLFVRALDADGGERWIFERSAVAPRSLAATTLTVTEDGQLVVVGAEQEGFAAPTTIVLTGLDLDGAQLWSQSWEPPEPVAMLFTSSVAAPGGGVFVAGYSGQFSGRAVGRFDAAGAAVWVNLGGDEGAMDLELDPGGVPHVLTPHALISYLP